MDTPVPDRKGHDRRYSLDDGAIRALGYASHTPVRRRPDYDRALVRRAPRLVGAAEALQRGGRHPAGPVSTAATMSR
jgi:hypothetical protein